MITHRLPFRPPFDSAAFAGFLRAHQVTGVDVLEGRTYARTVPGPSGPTALEIDLPGPNDAEVTVRLGGQSPDHPAHDHPAILDRVRHFLGLDADPAAVTAALARDSVIGPLVAARPGVRVPGSFDPFQTAVFAILGQQISLARARVLDARFHAALSPDGVRFPMPAEVARLDPEVLAGTLGMPRMRGRAIVGLAGEFARLAGELLGTGDVRARLLAVPGVGPWTVDYLLLRCLSDPDAYVPGDLVLRRALAELTGRSAVSPRDAQVLAEPWRPYRAYALMHLWTHAAY